MLQRLMANIDLFQSTRKCFQARENFDVHTTTKHSEQDPFPDQIKAMHFVLKEKFLRPELTRDKVLKFGDSKKGGVPNSNYDAYEAGKQKVLATFEGKKYSLFGVMTETETESGNEEMDSD